MKKMIAALAAFFTSVTFGATLSPITLLNPAGSSSGQAIVSTGPSSAPAWGVVGLNGISAIAANTVLANATGSSAAPTAFAMPSCSTSSSALDWTTSTGFTCNTSINAATLGGATFASPGAIGSTTASTGAFTNLSSSGTVSGTGFSNYLASPPAIGGTAAAAGSFTTLSASSTVSGTGFSTYLASPPAIGGTTAAAGKFTTLQATSTITPSTTSGIVGTTAADNANAGSVGEVLSGLTETQSATSGTILNAASVSLTAGDWDVYGTCETNPAATTTQTIVTCGISNTSITYQKVPGAASMLNISNWDGTQPAANLSVELQAPATRANVSSTTTYYLVSQVNFATSTLTVSGYIWARRRR